MRMSRWKFVSIKTTSNKLYIEKKKNAFCIQGTLNKPRAFRDNEAYISAHVPTDERLVLLLSIMWRCYQGVPLIITTPQSLHLKSEDLGNFRKWQIFFPTHVLYVICRVCNKCVCSISTGSWMSYAQWRILLLLSLALPFPSHHESTY
jgi:hypothetical protein